MDFAAGRIGLNKKDDHPYDEASRGLKSAENVTQ